MSIKPGWLDLPEALEFVSQHESQRPFDGLSQKDAKRVFRKLEELLLSGNIDTRVYIENRAVPLTIDDMLSKPFRIYFEADGVTPGVEVVMRPDRLSQIIVNKKNLEDALRPQKEKTVEQSPPELKPPASVNERRLQFEEWLREEMQNDSWRPKIEINKYAKDKFGVVRRDADEIRHRLAKSLNRVHWINGGRRKHT